MSDDVTLELNTLGDPASRRAYRELLVGYLSGYRDRLSADSQLRLERNPLRILDSKDAGDREILKDAPTLDASLNDAVAGVLRRGARRPRCARHRLCVNPLLVRGLDYYTHTAFEFTTDKLGAQGAVIAGGRYDGLVAAMGGPDTPGIGWAAGVERLAMLLDETPAVPRPVAVVPIGDGVELAALQLAEELRRGGHAGRVRLSRQARPAPEARRRSACPLRRPARRGRAGRGPGGAARPRPRRAGDRGARRACRPPGPGCRATASPRAARSAARPG